MELAEFSRLIELLAYYNEIRDLFAKIDLDNDRRISFDEFRQGHKQLGLGEDQLQEEFDAIDANHGGFILFDEVCCLSLSLIVVIVIFCSRLVLYPSGKEETSIEFFR